MPGAPEVFVDNPLCPTHTDNFWGNVLAPYLGSQDLTGFQNLSGLQLIQAIETLYRHWNKEYCKGQYIYNVGLQDEAYFRYFSYADFLTPHSGLIQIRKYSEQEGLADMQAHFATIADLTKQVRARLYALLVEEMRYFE